MSHRRIVAATAAVLVAALLAAPGARATAEHTVAHETVTSFDGTPIAISIFRPAGAAATDQRPVLLHSHGWAGARADTVAKVRPYLDAGFGVVSIDQRGHGESGGQANVQDPDYEARDVQLVIDRIAALDWVRHDRDEAGHVIADDPVLGAVGGSYGGGYQLMTALAEVATKGHTRFNALAPEITWHDLPESLAPDGVPRTAWTAALYAVGARMLPQYVHESFAYGASTGQWPDGSVPGTYDLDTEFTEHSPVWFSSRGITLDIPVIMGQGLTDNLFNLNEGWHNFEDVLTPEARARSIFVGYNGGHALPTVVPTGMGSSGDPCTGSFRALAIEFFERAFAGADTAGLTPTRYGLATADGSRCVRLERLDERTAVAVGPLGGGAVTTTGAGGPVHLEIADGPITVAGIPLLHADVTTAGVDTRAFFALSVGATPADARVVQHNMLPIRKLLPVTAEPTTIELPGIAVDVPAGQKLFLTISPISDLSFGHGSRTPGAMQLDDLVVEVPSAELIGP